MIIFNMKGNYNFIVNERNINYIFYTKTEVTFYLAKDTELCIEYRNIEKMSIPKWFEDEIKKYFKEE